MRPVSKGENIHSTDFRVGKGHMGTPSSKQLDPKSDHQILRMRRVN